MGVYSREDGAIQSGTNSSMVLFRSDGSKYRESNIRWVQKDGVHARSKVLGEWELNDTITKEAALEISKFHSGVMEYLGKTVLVADSWETRNFYYNCTPFDDIQAGILVASVAQGVLSQSADPNSDSRWFQA